MLDVSFCVVQNPSPIWAEIVATVQITLGALMCLLVVIQFFKESLQMYKATKRFQLSRYTTLLLREGMVYFLAYVPVSSFSLFPQSLHATKLMTNYYE